MCVRQRQCDPRSELWKYENMKYTAWEQICNAMEKQERSGKTRHINFRARMILNKTDGEPFSMSPYFVILWFYQDFIIWNILKNNRNRFSQLFVHKIRAGCVLCSTLWLIRLGNTLFKFGTSVFNLSYSLFYLMVVQSAILLEGKFSNWFQILSIHRHNVQYYTYIPYIEKFELRYMILSTT